MFKHARIYLRNYILALEGAGQCIYDGEGLGNRGISKSGHAQKRQYVRDRNLNSDPPVPLISCDLSWPESQVHFRGTGYESSCDVGWGTQISLLECPIEYLIGPRPILDGSDTISGLINQYD
jgi:hypothetical protein